LYEGDIAAKHIQEAVIASKFKDYPLRRVREWAEMEEKSSLEEARWWRERSEERQA
jgi:hypothetical protein